MSQDQKKSGEMQAWLRFLLGILTLLCVVWGASGNVRSITNMALGNQKAIAALVDEDRRIKSSVRELELSAKEVAVKQGMMVDSLNRIEVRLGTK